MTLDRRRSVAFCSAFLLAAGAQAQSAGGTGSDAGPQMAGQAPDGGSPPSSGDDADLKRELEQALQRDAAASSKSSAAAAPKPSADTAAGGGSGEYPTLPSGSAQRGIQSLNPDISVIIDANAGYERRTPSFRNSLDPILRSTGQAPAFGPAVQEIEIAASAVVDPYFKGELYLSIPNLNELEVEEGFVTTSSLPWNLQA